MATVMGKWQHTWAEQTIITGKTKNIAQNVQISQREKIFHTELYYSMLKPQKAYHLIGYANDPLYKTDHDVGCLFRSP